MKVTLFIVFIIALISFLYSIVPNIELVLYVISNYGLNKNEIGYVIGRLSFSIIMLIVCVISYKEYKKINDL